MKNIYRILCLGLIAFGLCACDDFLETNPSSSVADTEVFKTLNGAQAALNGCYYQLHLGSGGQGRQDDWGYQSHLMTFSADGEDCIVWGGWYSFDYNYWGHTRGDIFKSNALWTYYYRLINNTNSIITYIDDAEGDTTQKNYVKGQALAMRGWAYFHLVRLFQHTYSIAKDMPGVPVYTEPTTDQTEGQPRGTVKSVYNDRILPDLKEAETLLEGFTRSKKSDIDQSVTRAFLAQVYLTMEDWNNAATYANKARAGYPLTSNSDYYAGFNDISTPSWMWGMIQTDDDNFGDYSPFAMWANWIVRDGNTGWTFQCYFVSDEFVSRFEPTDIRAGQFSKAWDVIEYSSKFYDKEDLRGAIVYMRSEEMLLTEAEALARSGQETGAKDLLNELRTLRGASAKGSTGQALIDDILMERRLELYGEGLDWFDIKRNRKGLVRGSNHSVAGGDVQIPADSWRFVYQIPNSEIVNNANMTSEFWPIGDQNPFDGVFQP